MPALFAAGLASIGDHKVAPRVALTKETDVLNLGEAHDRPMPKKKSPGEETGAQAPDRNDRSRIRSLGQEGKKLNNQKMTCRRATALIEINSVGLIQFPSGQHAKIVRVVAISR